MNVTKFIAWAITGAGHLLGETFLQMEKLTADYDVKVTTFLSRAALDTVRIYGLVEKLAKVSDGSYYSEILREDNEIAASPHAGRFSKKVYNALVVSPATANTVAKIVSGIADSLVTNCVALAGKGRVPAYIIPTDQEDEVETTLPPFIDRESCRACEVCPPIASCPEKAVTRIDGKARIDLSKCHGLGVCVKVCPYGAVRKGTHVTVRSRKVDLENVKKLKKMDDIEVIQSPSEIIPELVRTLEIKARRP